MDNNKEWFLYVVDHHEGPLSVGEIKQLIKKGEAPVSSYVWKEGFNDWAMMSDVTEFGTGGDTSDGHGPFAFLTRLLPGKKNKAEVAVSAVASMTTDSGVSYTPSSGTGPDISDVDPSRSCWCLFSGKVYSGPYSLKNIVRKMNVGEIQVTDSIWRDGWKSFVTILNIQPIMEQVDPSVLLKKVVKKKLKKSKSAAAIGFGGKASAPMPRWFKSGFAGFVFLFVIGAGIYQGLALEKLDLLLSKIPGSKERVKALHLEPVTTARVVAELAAVLVTAKSTVQPIAQRYAGFFPEPLRSWISVIAIPETITPSDAETLREVAVADPKQGLHVATALPVGEEFNPTFLIAANVPDGTNFQVVLRGNNGTLLNAPEFEKTFTVEIGKSIATTPRFMYDGVKPLPKGEYTLFVYESDKQTPEITQILASATRKKAPPLIPADRVAFVIDSYFLGGKKDANYTTKLKEYQAQLRARIAVEGPELKEIALLLEDMANKSASRFAELSSRKPPASSKAAWAAYHSGPYAKMSIQLKGLFAKLTPEAKKNYALPGLYGRAEQTYVLTERLHQQEDAVMQKGARADSVPPLAAQAVDAINELKNLIAKVNK